MACVLAGMVGRRVPEQGAQARVPVPLKGNGADAEIAAPGEATEKVKRAGGTPALRVGSLQGIGLVVLLVCVEGNKKARVRF